MPQIVLCGLRVEHATVHPARIAGEALAAIPAAAVVDALANDGLRT